MKMLRKCFGPLGTMWDTVRMSLIWQKHAQTRNTLVVLIGILVGAFSQHKQPAIVVPPLARYSPVAPAIKKAPKAKPPVLHQYLEVLPPVVPQVPDTNPRPVVWVS